MNGASVKLLYCLLYHKLVVTCIKSRTERTAVDTLCGNIIAVFSSFLLENSLKTSLRAMKNCFLWI